MFPWAAYPVLCGRPPSPCTPSPCTSRRVPVRRRRRAGGARGPRPPRSAAPRPPLPTDPGGAARALAGRSAGSRTPVSRLRRPAAPPRERPSRRRGTSTAWRLPTGPASRSHAAIENVPRIRQLGQVDRRAARASSPGTTTEATSGRASAACTPSAVEARTTTGFPSCVRCASRRRVGDVVEDECAVEVDLAFDGDLRHAAPGRAEPALPHTVIVSPGLMSTISTPR